GGARAAAAAVPECGCQGRSGCVRGEAQSRFQGTLSCEDRGSRIWDRVDSVMATASTEIQRTAPDRLFINGEWASAPTTFPVYNPATGDVLTEVAEASGSEVNAAVAAARSAFEGGAWRKLDASARGVLLWRIADALEA